MSACCPDVGKISVQENEAAANRVKMLHLLCQWKTDPCPTSHQSVTWASSIHLFSPNTLIPSDNQSHTELLSVELLSSSWTCPLVLFHSLCHCHCPDLNYNLSTSWIPDVSHFSPKIVLHIHFQNGKNSNLVCMLRESDGEEGCGCEKEGLAREEANTKNR